MLADGTSAYRNRIPSYARIRDAQGSDQALSAGYISWGVFKAPTFQEWSLQYLNALYLDLDFYKSPRLKALGSEGALAELMARIDAEGLPRPSLVLSSGRGLFPAWVHQPVRASHGNVERWKSAMTYLVGKAPGRKRAGYAPDDGGFDQVEHDLNARHRLWAEFQVDASGPSKQFRIAGSVNVKARKYGMGDGLVRMLWPASKEEIVTYDFATLCDSILPYSCAEARAYKASRAAEAQARRENVPAKPRPNGTRSSSRLWAARYRDLLTVVERKHGGRVGEGARAVTLALLANARAWVDGGDRDSWTDEHEHLVALDRTMRRREARSCVGGIDRRLRAAEAGKVVTWKGEARCPRLRYRNDTLCETLGIGVAEARAWGLRSIIPSGPEGDLLRRQRRAEYAVAWRQSKGAEPREEARCARLATGREALALRSQGLTVAQVLEKVGGSRTTLYKAMAEARENAANDNAQRSSTPTPGGTPCTLSRTANTDLRAFVATAANDPIRPVSPPAKPPERPRKINEPHPDGSIYPFDPTFVPVFLRD